MLTLRLKLSKPRESLQRLCFGFFLVYSLALVQPTYPAEYYKCVDDKGRLHIANTGCPSNTKAVQNHDKASQEALSPEETSRKVCGTPRTTKEFEKWQRCNDQVFKQERQKINREYEKKVTEIEAEAQKQADEQGVGPEFSRERARSKKKLEEEEFKRQLLDSIKDLKR